MSDILLLMWWLSGPAAPPVLYVCIIAIFMLASINKKLLSCLGGFGCLRGSKGGDGGEVSESIKKGKFVMKIFFSYNVEWSSKNLWKTISVNVKAIKTTRNKRSGGYV